MGAAAGLLLAAGPPAYAQGPGGTANTLTTFELTTGPLTISAPASVDLGDFATGTPTISGSLGNVTVSDNRGIASGTWTASVTSADFGSYEYGSEYVIPSSDITYIANTATTTGTVTLAPPGTGPLDHVVPLAAQQATSLSGVNTATWDATINVTIPASFPVATYFTRIFYSVA